MFLRPRLRKPRATEENAGAGKRAQARTRARKKANVNTQAQKHNKTPSKADANTQTRTRVPRHVARVLGLCAIEIWFNGLPTTKVTTMMTAMMANVMSAERGVCCVLAPTLDLHINSYFPLLITHFERRPRSDFPLLEAAHN